MRYHFVIFSLCLFLIPVSVLPAQARAWFYRVTPATQHQSSYALAVTAGHSHETTLFTVLVQARHNSTLSPFHTAFVNEYGKSVKFGRWQTPNTDPQSSRALVSLSNRGGLHYQFVVPNSQLSSMLFIYENEGYTVDHGKVRMMRSADFCWFRCWDFVQR